MSHETQEVPGFRLAPQQEQLFVRASGIPATQAVAFLANAVPESVLRSALDQLVTKYEILRTTFVRRAGMRIPEQVINDDLPIAWTSSHAKSADLDSVLRDEAAALGVA